MTKDEKIAELTACLASTAITLQKFRPRTKPGEHVYRDLKGVEHKGPLVDHLLEDLFPKVAEMGDNIEALLRDMANE